MPARRKSDEQKKGEGTFQPSRGRPDAPKLPTGVPKKPAWLSAKASTVWDELSELLVGMRVLTEADALALEATCEAYGDVRAARDSLKKHGGDLTYETIDKNGNRLVRPYPEVAMLNSAKQSFRSYLISMGLTPTDRERLTAQDKDGDNNPFADIY